MEGEAALGVGGIECVCDGGRGGEGGMIYSQITCHFFFLLKAEILIEIDVCKNRGTITR